MNFIEDHHNTLFLGDLSSFVDEHTIIRAFERFGPIVSVRVKRSSDGSNKPLCYGFIEFRDHVSAVTAQRVMNGCILEGRRLRVQWATANHDSEMSMTRAPKSPVQVLVSFISHPVGRLPTVVTEHHIREVFEQFGVVTDCVVKKSTVDSASGKQSGYGFVHFEENERGVETALNVIDRVKRYSVGLTIYDCRLSTSLQKYLESIDYPSYAPYMNPTPRLPIQRETMLSSVSTSPPPPPAAPVASSSHLHQREIRRSISSGDRYQPLQSNGDGTRSMNHRYDPVEGLTASSHSLFSYDNNLLLGSGEFESVEQESQQSQNFEILPVDRRHHEDRSEMEKLIKQLNEK